MYHLFVARVLRRQGPTRRVRVQVPETQLDDAVSDCREPPLELYERPPLYA